MRTVTTTHIHLPDGFTTITVMRMGGPDICPGLKAPILKERNPDERPGHITQE
jgi:hypothetical protein